MDGSASVLIDAVQYQEEDIQRELRRNSTCALRVQCSAVLGLLHKVHPTAEIM